MRKLKTIFFIVLLLLSVIITGCARTVTPLVSFGTTAVTEITLRGNVDVTNATYYMIISTRETYYVPSDPYPLIEPDKNSANPLYDRTTYFANYYSTWDHYVVLGSSGQYLRVPGPFISTQDAYTKTQIEALGNTTTVLRFNVPLEQMFPTGVPTRIYFDFVAVNNADDILEDHLPAPSKSFLTYKDTEITGTDPQDTVGPASMDIISWRVLIQ